MRYLLLVAIVGLAGCASPYDGLSPEATENRKTASAEMLDLFAPQGCSFNSYKNVYQCDQPRQSGDLNDRVVDVRRKIEDYLFDHPYLGNKDEVAKIIMVDLYQCKEGEVIKTMMYCNARLPDMFITEWETDTNATAHISKVGDKYKYTLVAR